MTIIQLSWRKHGSFEIGSPKRNSFFRLLMNIPEIFKYNSLLSIPLFSIINLFLIRKAPDFSFHNHTVSKTINFLNRPTQAIIFRFNFILKALLDLGFVLYILNQFRISFGSPIALTLILSAFLFGTLACFVEGKHTTWHQIVVYTSSVLWAIGQICVARLIGNSAFILFTIIFGPFPVIVALGFCSQKKLNVFIQAVCMSMWYIWLIVFVFKYL